MIIYSPYSYAGLVLIFSGLALTIWARRLFSIKNVPVRPGEGLTEMVTSGPFKFTRNPMYLGFTTVLLGGSVALGSLASFVGPVAFWTVINFVFIPFEEKKLERAFSRRYLDYKQKVRRWV